MRAAAKLFGVIFLVVGILGFIAPATPHDELLGIFHIDPLHNAIHLASGLVALWAGFASYRASRLYFQIFGLVYGLVAVLGFIAGEQDILGLVANNTADNWLHVAIAAAALALGFGSKSDEA